MFMKHKHTPWGTDRVAGGMNRAAVSWAALVIGGFPTPTLEHMYWLSCGEQELCISGSVQRESVVFPWAVWGQLRPAAEIHSTQNAPNAPCFLLHQPWQVVFVPMIGIMPSRDLQPWKWSCHSFVGLLSAWVLCRRPTIEPPQAASVFSAQSWVLPSPVLGILALQWLLGLPFMMLWPGNSP